MVVNYTIKRNVTQEVWKWEEGKSKLFRVDGPIRIGRAPKPGATITKAAELIDCTDLTTGRTEVLVAGKVVRDNLVENYDNDSYVGKFFRAVQGPIKEGKKYKTYTLEEIDWTGEVPVPATPTPTPSTSAPATPTPPTKPSRGRK
jgi:hypothetical protein